jgi:hypothetical protein
MTDFVCYYFSSPFFIYQTISYANGPGYKYHHDIESRFWRNLSQVELDGFLNSYWLIFLI